VLFYPASGAFVSLSQATLMDFAPNRHEQNMARWTFAGSIGVRLGPLVLSAAAAGGWGWRGLFWLFAGLAALTAGWLWRTPFPPPAAAATGRPEGFRAGLAGAMRSVRQGEVLRWLLLLQFADLMLDVFFGYLALYFVDVVGVSAAQAALAVLAWTAVGLAGDFLIIPALERMSGLDYLRLSAALVMILFPAFLLVPGWWAKLALAAALGLLNSGWYAILQGRLYSAMPGRSGSVVAVGNLFGWFGALLPLAIGLAADRLGLGMALWLLLAAPIALLVGLPYNRA
jgi:FSR family fosmidomycin resistance protein-like MFS transporter